MAVQYISYSHTTGERGGGGQMIRFCTLFINLKFSQLFRCGWLGVRDCEISQIKCELILEQSLEPAIKTLQIQVLRENDNTNLNRVGPPHHELNNEYGYTKYCI